MDTLDEEESYSLTNVVVRQYKDYPKYLSMAKTGSDIVLCEDIGEVQTYHCIANTDQQRRELFDATIIAVMQLTSYKGCLICKARMESERPPLGRCSKCSMLQRMDKCKDQLSAKLLMESYGTTTTLHAFGNILLEICKATTADEITQERLLNTPPLTTVFYNDKNVITGVSVIEDLE